MQLSDYQRLAYRTEAPITDQTMGRLGRFKSIRLLHAAIGMATEAGEFQDALKRHIYYNDLLDETNLAEEMGDLLWYLALAANALGIQLSDVAATNIAKLRARYPDKFTEDKATNRDIPLERAILDEGGTMLGYNS